MNAKRKSIRKKERQMIYKKYHGICQICGTEISYEEMTIDHIIPLDAGGKMNWPIISVPAGSVTV